MAKTLAELKTSLISRVRADMSSPAVNNLDNNSIITWFRELAPTVIKILKDPAYFSALMQYDVSVGTISGGSTTLPTSPVPELIVGAKVTSAKREAELTFDPNDFNLWDSKSWLTTPSADFPMVLVANGKVFVKPTNITAAYLDFIKKHPAISTSAGSVWSETADTVMIELLAAKYFDFRNHPDLAEKARAAAFGWMGK